MPRETCAIFMGVAEGYDRKEGEELTPTLAHDVIKAAVAEIKPIHDKNIYYLYPGLAIYRQANHCPEGGEPVAAIITAGHVGVTIETAKLLKQYLKQSTVTVASYEGHHGEKTTGFYCRTDGEEKLLGRAWQAAAEDYYKLHGIEITCGLYRNANQLIIQSELNPQHKENAAQWKQGVTSISERIQQETGIGIPLHFRFANFTYLD